MTSPLFLGLMVTVLGDSSSDAVKKDIAAFQGQWKVRWLEQDGKKLEMPERVCIFRGTKCKWFKSAEAKKGQAASFKIDPTCTPKIIDYTSSAQDPRESKREGIYKIDGDTMIWCLDVGEGVRNRPLEFKTKPGSNRLIIWFTRIKAKEKEN
jgi:uncharacterized protein (TIGR03067 family)